MRGRLVEDFQCGSEVSYRDTESVLHAVVRKLDPEFYWVGDDELTAEGWLLLGSTDILSKAESIGALYVFLEHRLRDSFKNHASQPEPEAVYFEDLLNPDGSLKSAPPSARRDVCDDHFERSELLSQLDRMGTDDFIAHAELRLGKRRAKQVEIVLKGSTVEQRDLWTKYVKSKRHHYWLGSCSKPEDQEVRLEEWESRYRVGIDNFEATLYFDDLQAKTEYPLVLAADGETIKVATTLRQSHR